ncbi:hypothetical protein CDD80_2287 [Ophiocordyceps camponoti-rufipedis]|uniref:DUF7905 domain-containing protein n=1 Tax=Ophiocordyceps camponoti-rufipedis TaxID=2004952 RepID=A0A2C5ZLI3_9HYPO|nr:hypothetical protein CDD80_2287 [Ophiocordyceps camponoti-rufipedis]
MASAKFQMDSSRRTARDLADMEYLGKPPENLTDSFLEARLVIPGMYMIPLGVDDSEPLKDLRRKYKTWIWRSKPNVFELRTNEIKQLQNAMKELNWLIHDLRLSSENMSTRFVVQKPMNAGTDALVTVKLNSRPTSVMTSSSLVPIAVPLAHDNFLQLRGILAPSAYILKALGAGLLMRVNFGRFEIRQRKRGVGDEMTYEDFANMVALYSKRGGAGIHTRLIDVSNAEKVVNLLAHPDTGIVDANKRPLQKKYSVMLRMENKEFVSTVQEHSAEATQLSAAWVRERGLMPKLNWTVVAPDMQLDWNLQVDVCQPIGKTGDRDEFKTMSELMQGIRLVKRLEDDESLLQPPRVVVKRLPGSDQIEETVLKTSVLLPFKSTRYVVEVSISHTWARMETEAVPQMRWGIEFYGLHWEETLEGSGPQGQRDDWGAVVRTLWPSSGEGVEAGFLNFLEDIAEIQSALAALSLDSSVLR